jgi:hypothetical protein
MGRAGHTVGTESLPEQSEAPSKNWGKLCKGLYSFP